MPIVRKLLLAAVAPFAVAAAAQAPDPTLLPTFDVASVRQNKTEGTPHSNVPLDTGNVYSAIDPATPVPPPATTSWRPTAGLAIHRLRIKALRHAGTGRPLQYFDGLKSKPPGWVTGGASTFQQIDSGIEARAPDNSTIDRMR